MDYLDIPKSDPAHFQIGRVQSNIKIDNFAIEEGADKTPGIDITITEDDGQDIGIWVNDTLVHTYTPEVL